MVKIERIGPLQENGFQNRTQLTGLNNRGQVIGFCYGSGLEFGNEDMAQGFIWHRGRLYPFRPFSGEYTHAYGINAHGDVVGDSDVWERTGITLAEEDYSQERRPAFWPGAPESRPDDIAYRIPSKSLCAEAINNRREVLLNYPAELWRPGGKHQLQRASLRLPPLPKDVYFRLVALNNASEMLAYSYKMRWQWAPSHNIVDHWLYKKGTWTKLPLPAGATAGVASALNDDGVAVGFVTLANNKSRPYLWKEGKGEFLGMQEGRATALNHKGEHVGSFRTEKRTVACLWKDSTPQSLEMLLPPNSGWELYDAVGINDKGQIIGHGAFRGSGTSGFLLTP